MVFEFGTPPDGQKGTNKPPKASGDKSIDRTAKAAEKPPVGRQAKSKEPMATEAQKQQIKDKASDAKYEDVMTKYGFEMERMTYSQAEAVLQEIDNPDMTITCDRCGNAITGVVLPDGTTMKATELIAKSKLKYGGVYCFGCMKELKKAKAG